MDIIYKEHNYTIEKFNTDRLCIKYDDEILCKYDNNKDTIRNLIADFVYFCIEDKYIVKSYEKKYSDIISKKIKLYNKK